MKKLPHVLALHLKRFKLEQPNRSIKLSYRVVFPLELRLFNTVIAMCYLFVLCRIELDHILYFTDNFKTKFVIKYNLKGGRIFHSRLTKTIMVLSAL